MESIFPKEMLNAGEINLDLIISKLTFFQEQIHIIHWRTSSYAEHMATGGLYTYLESFRDEIVEKLMGYTGKRPNIYKFQPLVNQTSVSIVTELMEFVSTLKAYGERNKYHDICNMADSLSGEAAKVKYLLSLS